MKNRKYLYALVMFLLVAAVILGVVAFALKNSDKKVKVFFLDVGQGDSILISQGSNQILIDGGENEKVMLEKVGRYIPFWDRKIEVLIPTHLDKDHIGGLLGVFRNYKVESVIQTKYNDKSDVYEMWNRFVDKEGSRVIEAVYGDEILISDEAIFKIIYPYFSVDVFRENKSNDYGIGTMISISGTEFLLMGDLSNAQENEIIEKGIVIDADILKVGHHGSKHSSSENFLKKVSPEDAIISVGKDNRYGHPHQETIDKLKKLNINIFRTDESGDIVYECLTEENLCRMVK